MTLVGGGLYLADRGGLRANAQAGTQGLTPMLATTGLSADAAGLDERARKQGLRGLGHQFVIGNGSGMADGELFVSQRWMDQVAGAHTAGDNAEWFNRQAIGICLVGDGNRQRFSPAQIKRLHELTRVLCVRLGIPPDRVYLHSQIAPTTSPGRLFPEATMRTQLQASLIAR
jgi:N-acetyl-anhydromuramyl-L-alanine amidase AmpD